MMQMAINNRYKLANLRIQEIQALTPADHHGGGGGRPTFMYFGPQIRILTKIYKRTNFNIAFNVDNTIKLMTRYKRGNIDKFSRSGVYKLKCKGYEKVYIGQTGRSFTARYAEHISNIKHKKTNKSMLNTYLIIYMNMAQKKKLWT
jgi:hypothetical protein